MKSHRFILLFTLAPAALLMSGGCSKSDKDNASAVVQDMKDTAVDTWDSIKDFTVEKKADFSSAMDRMGKSMDDKIDVVRAKVAGVPDATSKEKAAAIKDYDEARADLKARLTDLGNATSDTWVDAKAKVAAAWQRVKADYDKATQ